MAQPKLTPLEFQILEALWSQGRLSIREIQEAFPEPGRPAYTTISTTVYRLEEKGVVQRIRKIGNAHIFDAAISREDAKGRMVDDLLNLIGGSSQFVMAHMVETGKLSLDDIREAEKLIQDLARDAREKKGKRNG